MPVAILGDVGTPYDSLGLNFARGIVDHTLLSDQVVTYAKSGDTITTRSKFDNHSETQKAGPGYTLANQFGFSNNEAVDINAPEGPFVVRYNVFTLSNIVYANGNRAEVRHNRFQGPWSGVVNANPNYTESNITIESNDFAGNGGILNLESGVTVQAPNNYWGTKDEAVIAAKQSGSVEFRPYKSSPDSDLDGLSDEEEGVEGTLLLDPNTDGDQYGLDGYDPDPIDRKNGMPVGGVVAKVLTTGLLGAAAYKKIVQMRDGREEAAQERSI